MSGEPERLAQALAAFKAIQAEDPTERAVQGARRPRALVHAEWLSEWVARLAPHASEALRLAAYCQHLRRWEVPRETYPEGRKGYLAWRAYLSKYHAEKASEVLAQFGFPEDTIEAVRRINMKRGLGRATDAQTMEDALCLTFLEHELAEFATKHPREKLIDIIQKTWRKLSDSGREHAQRLRLAPELQALVSDALAEPEG